ncbi:MAG TPA: Nif3-like dinuclear metal center hexameric protein [Pirellulales bacterium]|nr:Nif3-like dinuclear metal center hexameric protein [Pirellulales bacterium]
MITVDDVSRFLDAFAPLRLAEPWDNVGLLLGDRQRSADRIMTCLTITGATAAEAVRHQAQLVVVHHPLPFAALKRLTTDSPEGRSLWSLAGAGISIFSPHTAFDSAPEGINQRLAAGLGLAEIEPLTTRLEDVDGRRLGAGRRGQFSQPLPLAEVVERVKKFLGVERVQIVGAPRTNVSKIAVGCGSAGDLLADARRAGCECFVTGETRFHTALEAEAAGLAMILTGHYASERFAVEFLAELLAREFPAAYVWASADERDPLVWG